MALENQTRISSYRVNHRKFELMPEQRNQLVSVVAADLKALNESVARSADMSTQSAALIAQQTEVMKNMAETNERQTEVLEKMAAAFDLSVRNQLAAASGQIPALYIPIATHEKLMKWQLSCFLIVLLCAVGVSKGGDIATFIRGIG